MKESSAEPFISDHAQRTWFLRCNESKNSLVEDKSADDLFADFNESLLDDLLTV